MPTVAPTTASDLATPAALAALAALRDAVAAETRLVAELVAILERQRAAIARDDLPAVDDTIFATRRVARTLAAARRHRRDVGRLLGVPHGTGARALAAALGETLPADLREAIERLVAGARVLGESVERNRAALRQALGGGLPPAA